MTLYLIGVLVSMILSLLITLHRKEELLKKYTKPVIVIAVLVMALISWLYPAMALYKTIKKRFARGE